MDQDKSEQDIYAAKVAIKGALSWYGWGSPTGLGLFFVEIGAFLWLLHLANIIH